MTGRISTLPVKEMFGLPDLISRLKTGEAETILTAYQSKNGDWSFVRTLCGGGEILVSVAELGALERMKIWLNDVMDREGFVEE